MRSRWFVLMLAAALVPPASVYAMDIPLTVEEPTGVARSAEPVSGGIPLPAGQFKPEQAFSLLDGTRPVPVQVVPLVVDERGFLHWVLVDFQTDLKAREKKTFTLRTQAGTAQPPKPLKVTQDASGVRIDTGVVTLTLSADKPFGLFRAEAGGKPVLESGQASYTDAFDGKRYVADQPDTVAVEYAGPLRTTVCLKGRFVGDTPNKFQWIARVTAWAGRSDVHVKYTLSNSNREHYAYRAVKDSSVEIRLSAPSAGVILGAAKPVAAGGDAALTQGLRAGFAGSAKAVAADKALWTSAAKEVPEGWIATTEPNRVQVVDLYFTDDPARRLAAANGALVLTGVTERFMGEYVDDLQAQIDALLDKQRAAADAEAKKAFDPPIRDLRTKINAVGLPFRARVRWVPDCTHLSSQYLIDVLAPADAAALSHTAARAKARVWAMAPPAWYFETESLSVGKFGTQADELKAYDLWGWKYDPRRVPTEPGARIPRYIRSEDNHYETEEDIVESLLLMYLRTGRRAFFDATEAWANFHLDLQAWRTDGWRWMDGGVWWYNGPYGNKPQRLADPVTGQRNTIPSGGGRQYKPPFNAAGASDLYELSLSKACYCHNWGEGVADWFCLTGDRDALEAAIDIVEQNYDTQRRAFGKAPGKANSFSRDFTRASYLTNATRMVAPADPFVREASDYLAGVYLQRPVREPRGLVNAAGPITMSGFGERRPLRNYVGQQGLDEMQRLGVTEDPKNGQLTDPKTGIKWFPIVDPNIWMFPPMSMAMESYWRITGNEDARDWVIAYGEAVARVLYQRHGNQDGALLADFPLKGIVKDRASWLTTEDNKYAEGIKMSGYLAQFHPDVAARAYSLSGDPLLKQRAYDYWFAGSHRGYQAEKMNNLGGVGMWVNYYGVHSETVNFTGRTFYEWAHPRADEKPPVAVRDLAVTLAGDQATVTFTAPADEGGGKAVSYQVKCSDKPIVAYETFLKAFAASTEGAVTNLWMAANVAGEPTPKAAGGKESFTVTGVPAGAKYFVVLTFDDSSNRSALSNVAEAAK